MCLFLAAVLFCFSVVTCQRYIVPEASLEFLSPRGLKISIPDIDAGVTLVAFHVNLNEEFYSLEHGHWAQDIIKKRDGRWVYFIPNFKAKEGDRIYYWIYAIVDGLGYHGLDRVFKVTKKDPHSPEPATPQTPDFVPDFTPDRGCAGITTQDGGQSTCPDDSLLDTTFRNLDSRWGYEVQLGGTLLDDEFMVFTRDSDVTFLKDGDLFIKPVLLEDKYNETFVNTGLLNLQGCTSSVQEFCKKQGVSFLILPPVVSARLSTKGKFSFRYGTVEIKAKLPMGDWIVPELWLQPVSGGSEHIVLALSRGNADLASRLETGILSDSTSQLLDKTESFAWSQNYHHFKLVWNREEMVFSVDGQEIGRLSTAGFNKECYLTLGLHVAGSRDFPDNTKNKPWKNSDNKRLVKFWQAKNSYVSTWNENSALRVQSVKVVAL